MRNPLRGLALVMMAGILVSSKASLADSPAFTMSGYSFNAASARHFTIGYTFTVTSPITITALGTMDFGGDSIAANQPFPVNIYHSAATPATTGFSPADYVSGFPVPGGSALVTATDPILAPNGGTYLGGDGFRYHTLPAPITLIPDIYEIQTSNFGTGYAYSWTGVGINSNITGPSNVTFLNTVDDNADYATTVGPATFLPGAAGPNFLVAPVPEPAMMGLAALACVALVRRRSRHKNDIIS